MADKPRKNFSIWTRSGIFKYNKAKLYGKINADIKKLII